MRKFKKEILRSEDVVPTTTTTTTIAPTTTTTTTVPPTTTTTSTTTTTTSTTTTTLPVTYYRLNSCNILYGQVFTTIPPAIANQQYRDTVTNVRYYWDGTTTLTPGVVNVTLEIVPGFTNCLLPSTTTTTTTAAPMRLEVKLCGGVTTYYISVANQGLVNGLVLKLIKSGTPFDGSQCWEIVDNNTTQVLDYNLVSVGSISLSCESCASTVPTTTTSTTTTTTTCSPSTYYELAECSPGTGYAFTKIAPNLGVGQRYVLPSTTIYYTYTGNSITQCNPAPPTLNESIQKTSFTGCPSPLTTTSTTTLGGIGFSFTSACSAGSATVSADLFTGGSGTYEMSSVLYSSEVNAYTGVFVDASQPRNFYGVTNGTWWFAVRDKFNTGNALAKSVTFNCTTTTTTTTCAPSTYYELAECFPGTGYAFTKLVPDLGTNQRYVLPSPLTYYTYTGSGVTQCDPAPPTFNASIQKTALTGCPVPPTTTTTTTAAPMKLQVQLCGVGTTYYISVSNQGLTNGIVMKLSKVGTPFDGTQCWEIIDNATTNPLDYSLVDVLTISLDCTACAATVPTTTTTTSTTTTTTAAPTTTTTSTTTTTTLSGVSVSGVASCPGTCNGTGRIVITGSGGTGVYQYSIDGGATFGSSNTFSSLSNGTYYIAVRDSLGTVANSTVVVSCATTAANWQPIAEYECVGCNRYQREQDINACSPTYLTKQRGTSYTTNDPACGGCCGADTTPNWINNGTTSCYGTCNLFKVQTDYNTCSATYGQTRPNNNPAEIVYNSSSCGTWTYSTYCTGTTKYSKETNTCSGEIRNVTTLQTCSTECGANLSPVWTNTGAPYCVTGSCTLRQLQTQTNPCCTSPAYNSTQVVNTGVTSNTCGSWDLVYYCSGYDKYSKEVNYCTLEERNVTLVETNSTYCGYYTPLPSFGISVGVGDSGFACTRTIGGTAYCLGGDPTFGTVVRTTDNPSSTPFAAGFYHINVTGDEYIELNSSGVVIDRGAC